MVSLLSSLFSVSSGSVSRSPRRRPDGTSSYLVVLVVSVLLLCGTPSTYAQEDAAAAAVACEEQYEGKLRHVEQVNNDKRIEMAKQFVEESNQEKQFLTTGYEEQLQLLRTQLQQVQNLLAESDAERNTLWKQKEASITAMNQSTADATRSIDEAKQQYSREMAVAEASLVAAGQLKVEYDTKIGELTQELSERGTNTQGEWDHFQDQHRIQDAQIDELKDSQRSLVKRHEADAYKLKTENKENVFKLNKYRKEGKGILKQVQTLQSIVRVQEKMYCNYTNIQTDFNTATGFVTNYISINANYYYDINISFETQETISNFWTTHVAPRWKVVKKTAITCLHNGSDLGAHLVHTRVVHKQCEPANSRAMKKEIRAVTTGTSIDIKSVNRTIDNLCKKHQWDISKYLFHSTLGLFVFVLFRRLLWRLFLFLVFLPITIILLPFTVPKYFVRKAFGMNPDGTFKSDTNQNRNKRSTSTEKKNQ